MILFFLRRKDKKRAQNAHGTPRNGAKTLFDLKRGERATVRCVKAEGGALARLTALGLVVGAEAEALAFSLFHSSILVSCASVRISIRRKLAEKIEVSL